MVRLKDRAGQAILEYLLIVVIILAIAGGSLYKFNQAFKAYAKAYFVGEDSYLACIVKYGVLPGASEASSTCPAPTFNKNTNGSLANAPGGKGSNSNPKNSNQSSSSWSQDASSSSGGVSRASELSSSRLVPFGSGKSGQGAGGKAGASDSKSASTGSDGFSTSPTSSFDAEGGSQSSSGRRRRKGQLITEDSELGDHKKPGPIPATERDLAAARDPGFKKNKKSQTGSSDIETKFSFGNILKYLIIALLAFSIIFFLGSQIVAVSRSRKRK